MRASTVCSAGILSLSLAGGAKVCATKSFQKASVQGTKAVGRQVLTGASPRAAAGAGKRGAQRATNKNTPGLWMQIFDPTNYIKMTSNDGNSGASPGRTKEMSQSRPLSPGSSSGLISGQGSRPPWSSSFEADVTPRAYDWYPPTELQHQQFQYEQWQSPYQQIEQQQWLINQQILQQQIQQQMIQQQMIQQQMIQQQMIQQQMIQQQYRQPYP